MVSSKDEFTIGSGYFPPSGMTYASTATEIAKRTRRSCEGIRIFTTEVWVCGEEGTNLWDFGSQPGSYTTVSSPMLLQGAASPCRNPSDALKIS